MNRALLAIVGVMAISGCGLGLFQSPTPIKYIMVTPEEPQLGSTFTLDVDQSRQPSPNMVPIPDGLYPVFVSTDEVVVPTSGDSAVPTTRTAPYPTKRVQIGAIQLSGGKGTAQFVLQSDYGDGVKPTPGRVVTVNFIKPEYTGTAGFRVGKN